MPTASMPQMPPSPWTMKVQHGSSMFFLESRMKMARKAMKAAKPPMKTDSYKETNPSNDGSSYWSKLTISEIRKVF